MPSVVAEILNRIQNPFPAILDQLENLNRQLNFDTDTLSAGDAYKYGTLTASRRNHKPFIIGLLPPDNMVNFVPVSPSTTNKSGDIPVQSAQGTDDPPCRSWHDLPDDFWLTLKDVAAKCHQTPESAILTFYIESFKNGQRFCSSAAAPGGGAKGMWQVQLKTALQCGMSKETWQNLENVGPKAQIDPYYANYQNKGFNGKPTPNIASPYIHNLAGPCLSDPNSSRDLVLLKDHTDPKTGKLIKSASGNPLFSKGKDTITVGDVLDVVNKQIVPSAEFQAILARYKQATSGGATAPGVTGNAGIISPGVMSPVNQTLNTDPLAGPLGRSIMQVNEQRLTVVRKQTQELQRQIDAVRALSPLILLVNPNDFTRTYEYNTDDSPTGRYGHIVHIWQPKPLAISASGRTAGQYIVDAEGSGGLTNFYRVHSVSYQNLLSLLGIYKNNGIIFAGQESDAGIPIVAISVFVYYDNHIYVGHFNDFSITDSGDKPYSMEYSFKFDTHYDMELDGINENLDTAIINNLGF